MKHASSWRGAPLSTGTTFHLPIYHMYSIASVITKELFLGSVYGLLDGEE
jgi:hypothetical protein